MPSDVPVLAMPSEKCLAQRPAHLNRFRHHLPAPLDSLRQLALAPNAETPLEGGSAVLDSTKDREQVSCLKPVNPHKANARIQRHLVPAVKTLLLNHPWRGSETVQRHHHCKMAEGLARFLYVPDCQQHLMPSVKRPHQHFKSHMIHETKPKSCAGMLH